MDKWQVVKALTPLPAACVPELLEPTADLFRSSSLSGDMIDVIRDKAIAVREPAQRAGRTRSLWAVLVEGWENGWGEWVGGGKEREGGEWGWRTFYQSGLEVRRPDSLALSLECLPALPAADNGIDCVSGPVVARQGIREVIHG
jgi:hypothetical protein